MGLLPDNESYLVTAVDFKDGNVYVTLANGVVIGNPLKWFTWLEAATPEQRANVEFAVLDVYFPDLDDGLDVDSMLKGESITWAKIRKAEAEAAGH
jgi:hypothetical protein